MKSHNILTGPFGTNTYFVWDENTKEAAIIDPAADSEFIASKIDELEIIPKQIWLTHGHFDHVFATGKLQEKYNIPVFMNEKDEELFNIFYDQAIAFGFSADDYKDISEITYLNDGDTFKLANETIKVLQAPGHTKGSLCYITSCGAFVGDVIFHLSIGRTDLYGGNYSDLITSIRTKILTLPENTILYSGHGPKTTVKTEKKANPFLV